MAQQGRHFKQKSGKRRIQEESGFQQRRDGSGVPLPAAKPPLKPNPESMSKPKAEINEETEVNIKAEIAGTRSERSNPSTSRAGSTYMQNTVEQSEEKSKDRKRTYNNVDEEWLEADSPSRRKPHKNKKSSRGRSVVKSLISWILYLAVLVGIAFLLVHFVGQRTEVIGSSMEHTLYDGDNIIVDKISYRFHEPERFDVIVFPYQHEEDTHYIKRVIGLPGESVRIDEEGTIFINGEELQESYGSEVIKSPGLAAEEILLGTDEYFVLGDNRNASADSRDPQVGNVKRDTIVGKAWLRIWPLNKIEFIRHQ